MADGKCTQCPGKCDHSKHTNASFYFEVRMVKKELTRDELFKQY